MVNYIIFPLISWLPIPSVYKGIYGLLVLRFRVMRGNNASVRVLEKNGYIFVEEEFGAEDDPYGNGMLVYFSTTQDFKKTP